MGHSNGCITIIIGFTLAVVLSIVGYSFGMHLDTEILDTSQYAFTPNESEVQYSYIDTLNCQYVIAGDIEFLNDSSIDNDNVKVMILPLGTYDSRPPAIAIVGGDSRFGETGWSQLLVGNYWYYVWLQDISSDTQLSPEVLVDGLDCSDNQTLALIHFRQIGLFQ